MFLQCPLEQKGQDRGRGWLLHQADKAWPCVSSVVEGLWLAPGGLLLSTNRLRKLFSLLRSACWLRAMNTANLIMGGCGLSYEYVKWLQGWELRASYV